MIENFINNFVSNVLDVTALRNLDTPYTNNTGKTLFVFVSVYSNVNTAGNSAYADGETPSGTPVCRVGMGGDMLGYVYTQLTFVVPAGATYQVSSHKVGGDTILLKTKWSEAY